MDVERTVDMGAAGIAAAIGEPARARILFCLLDSHARTSTELAIVAKVSPSTARVHLGRLTRQRLVKVLSQGRHRYYSLEGASVAKALEALVVVAGDPDEDDYDVTPKGSKALATLGIDIDATRALRRRFAYACVDWSERRPHIGGALGKELLGVVLRQKWFVQDLDSRALRLTPLGRRHMQARFGIQI